MKNPPLRGWPSGTIFGNGKEEGGDNASLRTPPLLRAFPRLSALFLFTVAISVLPTSYSAVAEEPSETPPPSPLPAWTHVQMQSFMAPTVRPGSRHRKSRPMTLVLEVATKSASAVCSMSPRIQDAVVTELYQHPIRLDRDRHLDIESAEKNLLDPVNEVLRNSSVKRVLLFPGTRPVQEGVSARLPGSKLRGCGAIKS